MPVAIKSKKDVILEFRTGEILRAARAVFARHGFNSATVDEIAEAAGVAKGTVYLYFPSKRDLFLAALREGVKELHEEVQREIDAAPTARGKIRGFIHGRLAYCDRNRDFFRIYYTEFSAMMVRPTQDRPEFQDLYEQQAKVLENLIRLGIRRGEIRACGAARTAKLVFDLTRAAIAHHVLEGGRNHVDETTDMLCEFVWKGIGC